MSDFLNDVRQSLQSKLEDVLTSMPVGVTWADIRNGRIRFVNQKFTSMFGYRLEDLTTLNEWITNSYAVPEQASRVLQFWQGQQQTARRGGRSIEEVELQIRCRDGGVKTVLSSKVLMAEEGWALATFVDITPRKEEEDLIKQQALEDPLTGLYNRRAFSEALQESMERSSLEGQAIALLLLDLDGFKQINDSLGHDKGDMLLRHVADRLRFAVRECDAICRYGGDEFCLVVEGLEAPAAAERVAERIIREVAKPFHLHNIVVSVSVSVGIAVHPRDAGDEDSLFRAADRALYRAKDLGRGGWSH